MKKHTSNTSDSIAADLTLLSAGEAWDLLDPLSPDMDANPDVTVLGELPYPKLLGPGFERLCYELLITVGHSPRFFGRSGQRDYGVDIVVETDNTRTVYQCKNLANEPSWTDVRDAVTKFESDWLGSAGLPAPNDFVYCCPQPLDHIKTCEEWTEFRDEFKQRTGVTIGFWDKHTLDFHLHRLPDIVAGLFSGSCADHFCNYDNWLDTPWSRVHWGETIYLSIKRFLDRHRDGAIYIDTPDEEHFKEMLSRAPVVAIRGLPGSGKTMTGLELACRLQEPLRRIYYATFKDSPDVRQLWQSVSRRHNLPAVLILDDCHLNPEQADVVQQRLGNMASSKNGSIKLVLMLRDLPGSASGEISDTPPWLERLKYENLVLDMETSPERTRVVTEHFHHVLASLSEQRLERLHNLSGGDLMLLDELLRAVEFPQDIDALSNQSLYNSLRKKYFDGNRRLPTVQRLACLAQFDLTPPASLLDDGWQPGEKDLVASIMTELFAPPRYQFLHASMAELVLRALLALEMKPEYIEDAVIKTTESELIAYLRELAVPGKDGMSLDSGFIQCMEIILRSNLKLTGATAKARMKAGILNDKMIRDGIKELLHDCSFSFLNICLMVLVSVSHDTQKHYIDFIVRRFHILFENAPGGCDSTGMTTIGAGFRALSQNAPAGLEAVQDKYGAVRFLRLIVANGTLFELFRVLQYATPTFRGELLEQLDKAVAGELVGKTIGAGRSIGAFHFVMRDLGNADEALLGRLEQTIGAGRFLRLIAANGTLLELIKVLRYATFAFRGELLEQLDKVGVGELVDTTIAAGRSIESLHYTLNQLRRQPAPLELLEKRIGIDGWWKLLIGTGTLNSLVQIIRVMGGEFGRALIEASSGAGIADWRAIISRSLFHKVCTFTNEELTAYPKSIRTVFLEALRETAIPLAAKATWFDLNSIHPPTAPDSPEWQILQDALGLKIEGLKPEDLMGLDFQEAVCGLAFAWRERPDLRRVLAARLREILPGPADWPQKEGKVALLYFLLPIYRSELIGAEEVQRLLDEIHGFLTHPVCAKMHTMHLFLLLWSVCAIHYERGPGVSRLFEGALSESQLQTVLKILGKRVTPKEPNKEKLAQLALAGLIGFFMPRLTKELQIVLAPLAYMIKWLTPQALEMTFVLALFTLKGIALLKRPAQVFTPRVRAGLLIKAKEYDDLGPAIEFLCRQVDNSGEAPVR